MSTASSGNEQNQSKGIALITGASQGIGLAVATRLAQDGFKIALNDIPGKIDALQAAKSAIQKASGSEVQVFPADISQEAAVKFMIEGVVQKLGGLDVMVANAAVCPCGQPITEVSVAEWDRTFAVNSRGTFLCYKYAALQMIKQGRGGRIIGACSGSGKQGTPLMGIYSSTKFAIRGLTQAAAQELGKYGITVNAYAPGAVDTEMARAAGSAIVGDSDKVFELYASRLAVGRCGVPADMAGLVSYIASKDSQFLTGQTITIDGGLFFD